MGPTKAPKPLLARKLVRAGALSALLVGLLDPQEFSFFLSIQFITIIILGGSASLLGSVLGAGFSIILPEFQAGLDV